MACSLANIRRSGLPKKIQHASEVLTLENVRKLKEQNTVLSKFI